MTVGVLAPVPNYCDLSETSALVPKIPSHGVALTPQFAKPSTFLNAPVYRLLTATELGKIPSIRWAIKSLLPQKGLAMVYGGAAVSKTFLVLDMVAAIAEGRHWFGRKTTAAPVIYLCLEGHAGFVGRVKAWEVGHGRTFPALIRMAFESFSLMHAQQVTALLKAIDVCRATLPTELGPPLVVVDTLSRATPGADENLSTDMGKVLDACVRISEETGGLTLLVHHSGKDSERGPRGHSSLLPAVDTSILVTRTATHWKWEAKKVKDGSDGEKGTYDLETVVYGVDEDGQPASSCVVTPQETGVETEISDEPLLSSSVRMALEALLDAILVQSEFPEKSTTADADLDIWRAAFYRRREAGDDASRTAFSRSKRALKEMGYISGETSVVTVHRVALERMRQLLPSR